MLEAITTAVSAIHFAAPVGSVFVRSADEARISEVREFYKVEALQAILNSLISEYEAGYLDSMSSLVRGDLFSDFLEMAEELLSRHYKDAAAVIAGTVLEEHLRKLAEASSVVFETDGKYRSSASINTDLKKAGVYPLNEQQEITALLALRNDAAHGERDNYDEGQVKNMVAQIRAFMIRHAG